MAKFRLPLESRSCDSSCWQSLDFKEHSTKLEARAERLPNYYFNSGVKCLIASWDSGAASYELQASALQELRTRVVGVIGRFGEARFSSGLVRLCTGCSQLSAAPPPECLRSSAPTSPLL